MKLDLLYLPAFSVISAIAGYVFGCLFPLKRRKDMPVPGGKGDEIYKQHEPMFLLDHLHFGTKYRLHCSKSIEALLKQYRKRSLGIP